MWHKDLSGKRESDKCKFRLISYCTGPGLDIGCTDVKVSPHSLALGTTEACDIKTDLHANDALAFLGDNYYNYVFSSHFLEEFSNPESVLAEWWSKIKPGGHMMLYCDDPDFSPKVGTKYCRIEKKVDLYWQDVWDMFKRLGNAKKISATRHNECNEYSWQLIVQKKNAFIKKPIEKIKKDRNWGRMAFPRKKVTNKEALVIRYGAFGDMIWATPILKKLKEEGYYVVLNTSDVPAQIVREDPNIDEFLIQEGDAIPIEECEEYWDYIGQSFDKVINLCGVVEDKLLRINGRTGYKWSHEKRHEVCNHNYADALMAKAGFPEIKGALPSLHFTLQEELAAKDFIKKLENKFVILWSLSGSSFHKVYPWAEEVATVLAELYDNIVIITVGDEMCKILEWNSPNTICKSGQFTIRQSMVLTKYVDLVVGSETGILNAASCYDTPKTIFLSHSSTENLTKYWKNCDSLTPRDCDCYPCHQLHFDDDCPRGDFKKTAAKCAEHLNPKDLIQSIRKWYGKWQSERPDKKWVGFTIAFDELTHRLAKRVKKSFEYFHPDIPFYIYEASDEKKILGEVINPGPYPQGVSMRPRVCEKLLKKYSGVIYLDVDTVVAAKLDEFLKGDFDVAASLNVKGFGREALFNDGVFALTNKDFASQWTRHVYDKFNNYNNDQYAFNFLTNIGSYSVKVVDADKVYYNERSREFWGDIEVRQGKLFCNNRQLKVLHWAGGFKAMKDKLSCAKFNDRVRGFLDKITGTNDFTTIKGKDSWWPQDTLTKPISLAIDGLNVSMRKPLYEQHSSDAGVINEVIVLDSYRLYHLKRLIEPKVILDLGGHIGTFGLMAKKMWPDALLIAVEANPNSCSFYERNMIDNGFTNYHILNRGLTYNPDERCLVEDFSVTGGGILTTKEGVEDVFDYSRGSRTLNYTDVEPITIEDIIKKFNLETIDLAKWDIEGSELSCWDKMTRDAASKFKLMVGEFHIPNLEEGTFAPDSLQKMEYWEIANDKFPHLEFRKFAPIIDINVQQGAFVLKGLGTFEATLKKGE